jgi:hypothetical protein
MSVTHSEQDQFALRTAASPMPAVCSAHEGQT